MVILLFLFLAASIYYSFTRSERFKDVCARSLGCVSYVFVLFIVVAFLLFVCAFCVDVMRE